MNRTVRLLSTAVVLGGVVACSEFETQYFKHRVNEVTAGQVAKRYGAPHKTERTDGDKKVWTYFDRGSGTASYSGTSRGGICQAYVLTFDEQDVLRDWKQMDCRN